MTVQKQLDEVNEKIESLQKVRYEQINRKAEAAKQVLLQTYPGAAEFKVERDAWDFGGPEDRKAHFDIKYKSVSIEIGSKKYFSGTGFSGRSFTEEEYDDLRKGLEAELLGLRILRDPLIADEMKAAYQATANEAKYLEAKEAQEALFQLKRRYEGEIQAQKAVERLREINKFCVVGTRLTRPDRNGKLREVGIVTHVTATKIKVESFNARGYDDTRTTEEVFTYFGEHFANALKNKYGDFVKKDDILIEGWKIA